MKRRFRTQPDFLCSINVSYFSSNYRHTPCPKEEIGLTRAWRPGPAPGTVKLCCAWGRVGALPQPSTAGPGSPSDRSGANLAGQMGLHWTHGAYQRQVPARLGTCAGELLGWATPRETDHVRICVCGQSGMEV